MGAVSPYGLGVPVMMEGLNTHRSAVVNMKAAWENEVNDLTCWIGAPLATQFDPKSIQRKYRKSMGRTAMLSTLAAQEAVAQAGLDEEMLSSGRSGICFSSTTGSSGSTGSYFRELEHSRSQRNLNASIFFQIMSHTSAANLAHVFNIRGRVLSPNAACSSSSQSIGLGFEAIQSGGQDIMLCGGSDELDVLVNTSFDLVQASSHKYNDSPQKSPRPFDRDRDGTVCGEGAGCLVLESQTSAEARGADMYGEIIGFYTCSSGSHMAQPDTSSIMTCMSEAIRGAGISPDDIDYINAHATATIIGDTCEAEAIGQLLPDHNVPVSGLKGHIGHTLGASSALEMIASLKMMESGTIIPTLNLDNIDQACNMIHHVQQPEMRTMRIFMKNSFAFGGISSVLIVRSHTNE